MAHDISPVPPPLPHTSAHLGNHLPVAADILVGTVGMMGSGGTVGGHQTFAFVAVVAEDVANVVADAAVDVGVAGVVADAAEADAGDDSAGDEVGSAGVD